MIILFFFQIHYTIINSKQTEEQKGIIGTICIKDEIAYIFEMQMLLYKKIYASDWISGTGE
jgi:hypothetical protein